MNVVEVVIPYKISDGLFNLYAGGDEHGGVKHCDEEAIKSYVARIKQDKFSMWLDMGDKGEFIVPKDPRWDSGVLASWVNQKDIGHSQEKHYIKIHEPIKDTCIGLIKGNHEFSMESYNNDMVHNHICEELDVTDLGYSSFVRLIFRRKGSKEAHSFVLFATHGAGSATTKGGKLNRLQALMNSFDADMYAVGHMHELITDTKPYLTLDSNNKIVERKRVGAVTGCYFQTYMQDVPASYGERKNYPPTVIGSAVFTINPSTREIDVHRVEV